MNNSPVMANSVWSKEEERKWDAIVRATEIARIRNYAPGEYTDADFVCNTAQKLLDFVKD